MPDHGRRGQRGLLGLERQPDVVLRQRGRCRGGPHQILELGVLHSLTDANFLGYGCVLVEDCCATTSPDFCTEATVWNVKKCFGFVTDSGKILKALKK